MIRAICHFEYHRSLHDLVMAMSLDLTLKEGVRNKTVVDHFVSLSSHYSLHCASYWSFRRLFGEEEYGRSFGTVLILPSLIPSSRGATEQQPLRNRLATTELPTSTIPRHNSKP